MVPPAIKSNLAGLRVRERALALVWGVACTLSIALVLLVFACLLDWLIDRSRDTPILVRVAMLLVQLGALAAAGALFVVWPQLCRLSDSTLALWVEDKMPQFAHRLISAVQLNQPNADLGGMSKELIRVVTGEAEKQSAKVGFAQVADHRRLGWAAGVFFPVLLFAALPVIIWPSLSLTLLARQFMAPVDVPHSVHLESITKQKLADGQDPVWPSGEDIELFYQVRGEWAEDMEGIVSVTPEGQRTSDRYPLKFHARNEHGAIFSAKVNPSYADLTYSARLADGRTKYPSVLRIVARPVVTEYRAFVQVPTYVGLRPDGTRYEVLQARSEVSGIPGSAVKIYIAAQKPITEAMIELRGQAVREVPLDDYKPFETSEVTKPALLTTFAACTNALAPTDRAVAVVNFLQAHVSFRTEQLLLFSWKGAGGTLEPRLNGNEVVFYFVAAPEGAPPQNSRLFVIPKDAPYRVELGAVGHDPIPEIVRARRQMKIGSDASSAEITFDLTPGVNSYRVSVKDEYGFDNSAPPRRSLRLIPEQRPEVRLLRDTFDAGRDDVIDLEGVPVMLGAQFRVPYRFDAPFGMQDARVLYRVLKKHESGNEPVEDERWTILPVSKEIAVDPNPLLDRTIKKLGELIEEIGKTSGTTKTLAGKDNVTDVQRELLKELVESGRDDVRKQAGAIENLIVRLPRRSQVEEYLKEARAGMRAASEALDAKDLAKALTHQTETEDRLAKVRNELSEAYTLFDQKTGVFACTPYNVEVPFHAVPTHAMFDWSRKLGGGRVFVSTKGIVDWSGKPLQLKTGDQIEFCVEVFGRSRALDGGDGIKEEIVKGPAGRSEPRVATIVDASEFTNWLQNVGKEEDRVRMLELKQKGIFDRVDPK